MTGISDAYRAVAERYSALLLERHIEQLDEEDALVALLLTL